MMTEFMKIGEELSTLPVWTEGSGKSLMVAWWICHEAKNILTKEDRRISFEDYLNFPRVDRHYYKPYRIRTFMRNQYEYAKNYYMSHGKMPPLRTET